MAFMRHRPAAFITFCASAIAGTTTSHASLGVVSHNATGPAYAVTYADGYCYAGFGGRFHILTPELEIVSHFDLPSVIDGISTNGTTAYVATWFGGISVLNLVAPGGPQLLGTLSLPGQGRGIFVENGLAYVASSEAGIRVVDVSSASSPTELGFYDTSGSAFSIVIDGTNGYVADRTGGVVILNVAAPSTPQLVSTYSAGPSQRAYDVDKQGSNLFVAYGNAGLRVVDISNMSSPVGIGSLSVSGDSVS